MADMTLQEVATWFAFFRYEKELKDKERDGRHGARRR
jgi:hypothetical protein